MTRTSAPDQGNERISVTLLFSLIVHVVLILGLGFSIEPPRPSLPALDITLLHTANAETPRRADFLAQANNAGGGNSAHARKPGAPFSTPLPDGPGQAPRHVDPAAPAPTEARGPELVTTRGASRFSVDSRPAARPAPARPLPQAPIPAHEREQIAQLSAEVRAEREAYARRPHLKFISANTREYAFAAYMAAWVERIERIGNLNYPEAARAGHLHGELILTVGISRDGAVRSLDIVKSSGIPLLDQAAERIVRMAAPFPPLPRSDGRLDELYITRTWQFLPGGRLRQRAVKR
ncbi:TonB family protein [Metallibacterium sp.]|uniref:energy transducer TonB n=1 Tax=Metallibacterium sp. TaxID=2940281 RepID=UPI002611DC2B|nr:TonB family protein [Metallibacterium sp.]